MRNLTASIIFAILAIIVVIALGFHLYYGDKANLGIFIVTSMAALGTCGVTILNLFPYVPKDKLEAVLCWRKKTLLIMVTSKSNHTIYLGMDKYHTAEYEDSYALWWPNDKNCTEFNSRPIFTTPGDNVAVPPRVTVGYPINPKIFGKNDLNKIKIVVCTSSGYRIGIKKQLDKKVQPTKAPNDGKKKTI